MFAADLNTLNTNILNNPGSLLFPLTANADWDGFDLLDLGELEFRDESADPTADGRMRRSGDEMTLRMQDGRTNTVARPWAIWADTTGTPAASLGIGMLFQAESGDENPSDFGALDFVATDVAAGTEDTVLDILLRTAGAALGSRYRLQATGAFLATITHALTVARTLTIPDVTGTFGLFAKGADVASAATLSLGADGNYFDVTGVTGITAISTRPAGDIIILQFDGIVTLTHNATTLALIGAANYTTAAADVLAFISEGAGNWRQIARNSAGTTINAATQAEMEAASSTTVYASPGTTQYHPGVAKAWAKWGNTGTASVSYNTTSITDTGVGDHTWNIGTDFSSDNWAVAFIGATSQTIQNVSTQAAGTQRILGFTADTPFGASDHGAWYAVGFGDQ